jgi:hypothetical protein
MTGTAPVEIEKRFDRASLLVLVFAILFLAYQVIPEIMAYTLPTDGWSWELKTDSMDSSSFKIRLTTYMLAGSTPLQKGDQLLEADGLSVDELIHEGTSFFPSRPANWKIGQTVKYTVLRDGQQVDLNITLQKLTARSFLMQALDRWGNPWLALFMYLVFLPAMVMTGALAFYHQPRQLAAQALLIISLAFVTQLPFSPTSVVDLFTWYRSILYSFSLHRWTAIIIPSALLLALSFPTPKGFLRRHLKLSLALIYLPWWIGTWTILAMKAGDLAGIYQLWIGLALVQMSWMVFLVLALVQSFRTVRGAVERAQLRWFMFGLVGFVLAGGISWMVGAVLKIPILYTLVNYFGYLFLPLCLAVAILRYRLFDIDLIIRRSLVYSVLTALFGLIFFGSVTLLQQGFLTLSGSKSQASVVISTLLIAALFEPARRRIQTFIDRRFFRQKYDAVLTLENFALEARREVSLDALTAQLVLVVDKTIQPEAVSMWLRKEHR